MYLDDLEQSQGHRIMPYLFKKCENFHLVLQHFFLNRKAGVVLGVEALHVEVCVEAVRVPLLALQTISRLSFF